jgi:acetyl-CoA acyltransferase 1
MRLTSETALKGVEPRVMGISPIAAVSKVLTDTGLAKEDVDVWEVRCMN